MSSYRLSANIRLFQSLSDQHMVKIVCAKTLNHPKETSKGYDAIFADAASGIFVLCDGANSTPYGGTTARLISQRFGERLSSNPDQNIPVLLQELHDEIAHSTLDSGSTLVGLRVTKQTLNHIAVGDSFLYIFNRKLILGWRKAFQSKRDVDAAGNPWQLIGSPVYKQPNFGTITTSSDTCALLMSDGAGNFLSDLEILAQLKLLKNWVPSSSDLQFCTNELASTAFNNGSRDDISILMVWLRP